MAKGESIYHELETLPLRAIVAFASRCARRVQPLTRSLPKSGRGAVEQAIATSEAVSNGRPFTSSATAAATARTAATAVRVAFGNSSSADAADIAAAAAEAAEIVSDEFDPFGTAAEAATKAAFATEDAARFAFGNSSAARAASAASAGATSAALLADLNRLLAMNLGKPGSLGQPIDPSESGPLGKLWPDGEPDWYRNPPTESIEVKSTPKPTGDSELVIEIEVPEDASDEEILALAGKLVLEADDLHRTLGGHGLMVDRLEVYEGVLEPTGVPHV
jgi:hypothetical protein